MLRMNLKLEIVAIVANFLLVVLCGTDRSSLFVKILKLNYIIKILAVLNLILMQSL